MIRESLSFDVVIIGAGPAGLSASIRLAQLAKEQGKELSICLLEKAQEVGGHILSGAVIDPRALTSLLPHWKNLGAPLLTPVVEDKFLFLTEKSAWRLPTPSPMRNHGNYIISLGKLCKWLAQQAESLGVQIFPGFAASQLIFDQHRHICGVITGDKGIDKNAQPTAQYQPGVNIYAKQTLLAEGARGSLSKQLIQAFDLYKNTHAQTYAIGIKELWEVPANQHQPGLVMHSLGWPLNSQTYGGSFIYHLEQQQIATGFVIGLDYTNPYLDPYEEFQRFKTHPFIGKMFKHGKRICYGARVLNEGGWQSIPKLSFPGGILIGDCAGFLNVPRLKGIHTSMQSGIIAAETIFKHLAADLSQELSDFDQAIKESWVGSELKAVRNIRPGFHWGLWPGLAYAALDTYILQGRAPWTLAHGKADYQCLNKAAKCSPIIYPKHDGILTFDKLDSVYLSNISQTENQPCHLELKNPHLAIDVNLKDYDSPESFYCPAQVYEIIDRDTKPRLQINASNCIHCKTCDIKDPCQNINWVAPEGGDGPNYVDM